jgi:polyisoprenoid-binding protein YceI
MKKFLLLLLVTSTASTAFTPGKSTVARSAISFQIKNLGINTTGTISGLQANVQFNPANLAGSTIDASVDVNTINTDNTNRDEHLKSEDFFDAAHYPRMALRSVSFKHKSGNKYTGQFNLTLKGKSKLVELPFSYTEKNNAMQLTGLFKLNRLDFGIGESSVVLSNDVTVNIDVELIK